MTVVLGRAAVAPVLKAPNPRSEQVTQLLCGESAAAGERRGDWLCLRLARDGYEGWVHRGYLSEPSAAESDQWRDAWWSAGAEVRLEDGAVVRLDPGARVLPADGGRVRLPGGRAGTIASGVVGPASEVTEASRRVRAEEWALRAYGGAPYLWGGVTPRGVDCSGLVQMAFLLRGVSLPRDARQQAECGRSVPAEAIAPSDLLFFAESDGTITHVAFAADRGRLVHSALACGGVVTEAWGPGTRAEGLRARLVQVRRLEP